MKKKILVVESNTDLNNLIQLHLESPEYQIDQSYTSEDGLTKALANPYDLILVDMEFPNNRGLEIYQTLRTEHFNNPILMLTACQEETQTLAAFKHDQCFQLTKPFRIDELVNMVKSTRIN